MAQKGVPGEKGAGCLRTRTAAAVPMRLLGAVKDRLRMHQADHFRESKHSHMEVLKVKSSWSTTWLTAVPHLGVWPNASCLSALPGQGFRSSSRHWKLASDPS